MRIYGIIGATCQVAPTSFYARLAFGRLVALPGGRFRIPQQVGEVLFPDRRQRVRAVAPGLVAHGNDEGASAFDSFDFPFQNPQFRGINQIVGKVDSKQRCANCLERRRGIKQVVAVAA